MHAVFSFSLSVLPLFWSLWESCGFQRVRKGQPYCPRGQAMGLTDVTTCPCCSVSTPLVWLYSHLIISPPAACTLLPLAHVLKCDQANTQTRDSASAHRHTYISTTSEGPLLSNNHHTEQIKESRCSKPTHSSHFTLQRTLSAPILNQWGLFGWEKGLCPGERVNCRSGVMQRERGRQSLMMKN